MSQIYNVICRVAYKIDIIGNKNILSITHRIGLELEACIGYHSFISQSTGILEDIDNPGVLPHGTTL